MARRGGPRCRRRWIGLASRRPRRPSDSPAYARGALRLPRPGDRLAARQLRDDAYAHAPPAAGDLLSANASALPSRRGADAAVATRAPPCQETLPLGGRRGARPGPRGDYHAVPGALLLQLGRSGRYSVGERWARPGDPADRPFARTSPSVTRRVRRPRSSERRPDRLWRCVWSLRADGGELQHLLRFSRRRVRVLLYPAPRDLSPTLRLDGVLDRSVPDRPGERRSHRGRRVLVLSEARIPLDRPSHRAYGRARRATDGRRSKASHLPAHVEEVGGQQPGSRPERRRDRCASPIALAIGKACPRW